MNADNPPLLLSPNTAARMLDVSRSTVYQLMRSGCLSWVQIGADRRIFLRTDADLSSKRPITSGVATF